MVTEILAYFVIINRCDVEIDDNRLGGLRKDESSFCLLYLSKSHRVLLIVFFFFLLNSNSLLFSDF